MHTITNYSPKIPRSEACNNEFIKPNIADVKFNEHTFGIRAADIDHQRNSASLLINKMYAWRGYSTDNPIKNEPNSITLTASNNDGKIIGTLSLGIDSRVGLFIDQTFKDCIDPYRKNGKVCEIIKLAIDTDVKSKEIIASLFHIAFLYARDVHSCHEIFIEVNPRHRLFYEKMLSFTVECESRDNNRVEAPAVLLKMNIQEGTSIIENIKNKVKNGGKTRSFYAYFFSKEEEEGILKRLINNS